MNDSSTIDRGDRTSAEIERDVEGARARLSETLDELRDRASPGQLIDQLMDYIRGSGGTEFAQNLVTEVREKPLPVLMIGAGIGWLLLSGSRGATPVADIPKKMGECSKSVSPAVAPASNGHAGEAVAAIGHAFSGTGDRAAATLAASYGAVSDSVGAVAEGVSTTAANFGHDVRDQAAQLGASARSGMGWLLNDQPLVLGALGVALGAALGALLPATRGENRLMGETSHALGEKIKEATAEGYEQVHDAIAQKAQEAGGAAADGYEKLKEKLHS